jgi:hypothetical protein
MCWRKVKMMKTAGYRCFLLGGATLVLSAAAQAATVNWTGEGTDNNWSTPDNFGGATPAGQDVVFGDSDRTVQTTVNSVVDTDVTISSLTFHNTNITPPTSKTVWQVLQLDSGRTLTINGSGLSTPANVFEVGNLTPTLSQQQTSVEMTGGGAVVINADSFDFLVTQTSSNNTGYGILDMGGLGSFSANVADFYVGRGARANGTVTLAANGAGTNAITAHVLSVADSVNSSENSGTSTLSLGSSNTLHTDAIFVGAPTDPVTRNTQAGQVLFQSGLAGATVMIRGTSGGDSRADLTIASHGTRPYSPSNQRVTNRSLTSSVDFTGGTVDALLGTVLIGNGQGNNNSGKTGAVTGTLSMDAGTIDAVAVVLGRSNIYGSSNYPASGNLNISGGSFTAGLMSLAENLADSQAAAGNLNISASGAVQVSGGITMGTRTGTASADRVLPAINLTGGSLTVGGDIAEGTAPGFITSTVTIGGGTLNMAGHDITVDNFTLTSGAVNNLNQLTVDGAMMVNGALGSGSVVLNGATLSGAGTIAGAVSSVGGTIAPGNSPDTLTLSSSLTLDSASVLSFELNGGDITIGSLVNDLITGVTSLTLDGTLNVSETVSGSFLSAQAGDTWRLINYAPGNLSDNALELGAMPALPAGLAFALDTETPGEVNLTVTAVPEPASMALVVAGGFLMTIGRRRRHR